MVFNKKDLVKAFSPNKVKKLGRKRFSGGSTTLTPSMSGSTGTSVLSRAESSTNIKVIVRIRPHNDRELQSNCRTVIEIVDDKMLIFDPKEEENPFFYQGVAQKGRDLLKKQNKEMQLIFDHIFDMSCTNEDVFNGSTKDIITSLLDGYNCSVFAYGATGAGKTHTMLGKDSDLGITYRTVAELFSQIEMQSTQRDFNLGVTYLEVYNENVQDLLHKTGPLHIRDDGRCGIIVAGLKIITIHNAEDLLALLARGNKNRTQHPTDANQESSRSHAVFQVYVNITNKLDGQIKQVKLSMIDLAGSERASVTGCKGARFKEGANINKSLLALGNCINNLADGVKHIPYRDSKLTRLLKDSLGGNCRTVMVANVGPTILSYEDTYNTLRYANRAKKIKMNMKKNIVSCQMHVTGYIKMVEEQKKEIDTLKLKLSAYESGSVQVSPKNIIKIKDKVDESLPEMNDQMLELFEKKKMLNEKLLSLESADKILYCRIQYKKAADSRLCNLTEATDTLEEQNTSGKLRINKSVHYFKRQRESIRSQMESIWNDLRATESKIQELNLEIKSKGLTDKLMDKLLLQSSEIEKARMQQQFEHAKKISSLQQCEMQSLYVITRLSNTMLQNYYNMMRGYGTMTDQMKKEFKQFIKSLEGVKNIKWSDSSVINQEEDFYNLTCLSVEQLADPTGNELPIFMPALSDDEEQVSPQVQNKLNLTFDTPPTGITNVTNSYHSSVILDEKSGCLLSDNQNDTTKNGSIDVEQLNNTFNLQENNARKRILTDKNQVANKVPGNKLVKKTPPKFKQKSSSQVNGSLEKENKDTHKNSSTMSAKSIAILNRLKTERSKQSSSLKEACSTELSVGTLKAVRGKERRGLMLAHPYQKSNAKQKIPPAPPSTRVPW